MRKSKSTKQALLLSVMSLILCVSMLVGTTFAWFTDSVSTGKNTIAAGNLDVELMYKLDLADGWKTVSSDTELFDDNALWEPGYTQVVYLKVVNAGSLALKYQIGMNILTETTAYNVDGKEFALSDYIMFGTTEAADEASLPASREAARAAITGKPIADQYDHPVWDDGELLAGKESVMAVVAYMPESVGNEANYRGTAPSIQLGLNLTATQKTYEEDSFNDQYDADATLPEKAFGSAAKPAPGVSAVVIPVRNPVTNAKVATFTVPADAIADTAEDINVSVEKTEQDGRITVTADQAAQSFEITVTGLKEGNTTPVKVELRMPAGLTGVELYHNTTKVEPISYNSETGYVIFETTGFSPFTVVYDAEAKVEPSVPMIPENMPKAVVTDISTTYANTTLDWKGFSGIPAADAAQELSAVYEFVAPHDASTVANCEYKDWYCDYVVMIDKDIEANSIFLGGNYGEFGWVGFSNPEAVAANQEVYLLGSVTSNPWTYESVVGFVGTFLCGVGTAVDGETDLSGATFTVMLRMTNPDDAEQYYDVNVVTYKFN